MNKYLKLILTTLFVVMMMTTINAKTVNITDFGAIPDDGMDDSRAFGEALSDLINNGGGTLVFPSGYTDVNESVNYSLNNASYKMTGDKASVIRFHGDSDRVFFAFQNAMQFEIENLVFVGGPFTSVDAKNVFAFDSFKQISFNKCTFFNLGASDAIVRFENSVLSIVDTMFIGTAGADATIISGDSSGLSIVNSTFEDSGEFRGQTSSKPSELSQNAWVKIRNPEGAGPSAETGHVRIKDSKFGSAALYAFFIENQGSAQLSGVSVKLSPMKTGIGVWARNVSHFEVTSSSFSVTGRARGVFYLSGTTYLTADGIILFNNAYIGEMAGASQRYIQHCVGCPAQPTFKRK